VAWRIGAFHTMLAGIGKGFMIGLTITLAGETVRHGISTATSRGCRTAW
jgi:hypothetical protein